MRFLNIKFFPNLKNNNSGVTNELDEKISKFKENNKILQKKLKIKEIEVKRENKVKNYTLSNTFDLIDEIIRVASEYNLIRVPFKVKINGIGGITNDRIVELYIRKSFFKKGHIIVIEQDKNIKVQSNIYLLPKDDLISIINFMHSEEFIDVNISNNLSEYL